MKRTTLIQHNIIKRLFISSSDCLIRAENPTLKSYENSQFPDFFYDARINQAKATQFFFIQNLTQCSLVLRAKLCRTTENILEKV